MLIVEKDGLDVVRVEKGKNKLDVGEVKELTKGTEVYELVSEPMEKVKRVKKE